MKNEKYKKRRDKMKKRQWTKNMIVYLFIYFDNSKRSQRKINKKKNKIKGKKTVETTNRKGKLPPNNQQKNK